MHQVSIPIKYRQSHNQSTPNTYTATKFHTLSLHPLTSSCTSFLHVSMNKRPRMLVILLLILQSSVLITRGSSFSTKADYVPDPSIKCGECPCVSPCSPPPPSQPQPQPVLPPPTMVYVSPPPPQFVYETGLTPPPPPGFVYETGAPSNVYPSDNPFDLAIYSNSADSYSLRIGMFLMVVVVVSTLQLLVFW